MSQVYLVAVQTRQHDWEIEESLAELSELATDAGLEVVGSFVQKRAQLEAATLIGKGKTEEIAAIIEPEQMVIFDDELTPAQQGNLSDILDAPVLDRTQLILDIFAQRAQSKEGKLQVEIAQLNYLLPRLSGDGSALSRLGGGIGTRGPGETKLETDRRRIRKRLSDLQKELQNVKKTRQMQRTSRSRAQVPTVALVGYTNAGKSTLLNALSGTQVYAADQLFATLDPTIRRCDLGDGRWVFLSDTVGFLRRLPHTLIAAFQATLEEVTHADLLLHVIDASNPQATEQEQAVNEVLVEIGATQPVIKVYNKVDALLDEFHFSGNGVGVSARQGHNLDQLIKMISEFFSAHYTVHKYFFKYDQLGIISDLRNQAKIITENFKENGVQVVAEVSPQVATQLQPYEEKELDAP